MNNELELEMLEDENIVCKDCGREFVFTAGEQAFYLEKGLVNKPKCCKECRTAKKQVAKAERKYYTYCLCTMRRRDKSNISAFKRQTRILQ